MQRIDRTGEVNYNTQGLKMWIKEYRLYKDIDVEFENGWIARNRRYDEFLSKEIKNPYYPSVYNIGYLGEGEYIGLSENKQQNKCGTIWRDMLRRCYADESKKKRPTYIGCSVYKEWHNAQNFFKWFKENYYEIRNEQMCLDKDILIKGNKIYSPDTCVFVPQFINKLFITSNKNRGSCVIGVTYNKQNKKFASRCYNTHLGYYKNEIDAFNAYKNFKENRIKQIADEYKNKIPQKLYNAMYDYEVEITD